MSDGEGSVGFGIHQTFEMNNEMDNEDDNVTFNESRK